MGDQKKWGEATQDKKNREMRCKTKNKWGAEILTKKIGLPDRDKKNGETRHKRKKNGETRRKTKKMGRQDAR